MMELHYQDNFGKLYKGECLEVMRSFGDESIDLIVSSPPYFNLKEYSSWQTYEDYLVDVLSWFREMYRILKIGRHICWNIQDNIPEPRDGGSHYYALMPDTVKIAQKVGLEWERNVIWNKQNATQIYFGSFPFPPNIMYSPVTESVCIFRKRGKTDLGKKSDKSIIPTKLWNSWKNSLWTFAPETNSEHPAPFPEELPRRCITNHSFVDDTVLDPFGGSATTGVVAKLLHRNYILIERNEQYCIASARRLEGTHYQVPLF